MGLDIYFEKHSRSADNSAYEKAEQNLNAVDKQIDELLEDILICQMMYIKQFVC